MDTILNKASTAEGKSYGIQLSSLINYYNRKFEESEKSKLNWDQWTDKIQTKGLVDKIRGNVESLSQEKYVKEPVLNQVRSSVSPQEDLINSELLYHYTLWSSFYADNLDQHVSLKFIPRMQDLGQVEKADVFPVHAMEAQRAMETMNFTPWTFEDLPVVNYAFNQFRWGKRMNTFMKHPNDEFRSIKGTRTIMGR